MCAQFASYQIYRYVCEGDKDISHPNVLPVLEVSETLFPFCFMSPWMENGNITQYIRANPDVNRLMLVRTPRPEHQDQCVRLSDYTHDSSRKRAAA